MESAKFKLSDGKEIELHNEDIAKIAHYYAESSEMWPERANKFVDEYYEKARENLRHAFDLNFKPRCEDQVKEEISHAIRRAVMLGDFETAAEVLYEAMEFQSAYFTHELMEK